MKYQSILACLFFFFSSCIYAEINRSNTTARAGGPIAGLTANQLAFFNEGLDIFSEIDSVTGTEPGTGSKGLGPRFNMNSCVGCHAQPAPGGSSPATNPQVAVATRFGARNIVPSFIKINGPVREARFIKKPDGTPDGGVTNLFVITGRQDAPGCNIQQPDFATAQANNNVIFRIPTPVFGGGLIEMIPDSAILANQSANLAAKKALGIGGIPNREVVIGQGTPNRNGNDGTITRFGWKAQNKSLLLFAGEAYNVEMGVTNDIFGNKRDETPGCTFNGIPEDTMHFDQTTPLAAMSDLEAFAVFMRFLAPPAPAAATPASTRGATLFNTVGCNLCHTPSLKTASSSIAALSNQTVNLFSDLLLHHMGTGLADGVTQGLAGPDQFRTAPLWGVGERLFFLHDGRATDLMAAIQAHASSGSEANAVIQNFNNLFINQQADVIAFLQTL